MPVALREAAAWLVALNPMTAGWLVEADPESLAHHTAIIVSPEARRRIVAALLDRAPEVELGGMRWSRHLQRLAHPGLGEQLLLDRTLIWNQAHLLHALREYERHHNDHRPHRGIANARPLRPLPDPITDPATLTGIRVRRHDRLDGLLHEYDHAA